MEIFLNRVSATLASGINETTASLPLTTGHGIRFGTIGAGNKVRISFLNSAGVVTEEAYMTAISGDTATITRGQDGTSGVAHIAGDRVEARIGKSTMESLSQKASSGTDAIAETHLATAKTELVNADEVGIWDSISGLLRKITFANIKATLGSTFAALAGSASQSFAVSTLTAADTITPHTTKGIVGTVTNDSAQAGSIGEYVTTGIIGATAIAATNTLQDLGSISLTAGDWDISLITDFQIGTATITAVRAGVGTAAGASSAGLSDGDTANYGVVPTAANDGSVVIPALRKSIAATTTFYYKVSATFSAGTPNAAGRMSARRVR